MLYTREDLCILIGTTWQTAYRYLLRPEFAHIHINKKRRHYYYCENVTEKDIQRLKELISNRIRHYWL